MVAASNLKGKRRKEEEGGGWVLKCPEGRERPTWSADKKKPGGTSVPMGKIMIKRKGWGRFTTKTENEMGKWERTVKNAKDAV